MRMGAYTEIIIVAGSVNGLEAVPPAPDSWAAKVENEVAIWLISMEAQSKWELPPASEHTITFTLFLQRFQNYYFR